MAALLQCNGLWDLDKGQSGVYIYISGCNTKVFENGKWLLLTMLVFASPAENDGTFCLLLGVRECVPFFTPK